MKTLTAKDLVIGGKYVPHSKSAPGYEGLEDSSAWIKAKHRGQSYLVYTGVDKEGHTFWYEMGENSGDYFLPSDVTPYIEPDKEAKQYESPATLSEFESNEILINKDGICPVTGTPCDDECCPIGAECNASYNDIQECSSTDPEDLLPFSLEEALKAPERVVYRSGNKPLEWHWFERGPVNGRLVTILVNGNFWKLNDNGRVYNDLISEHCYDLMLLPLPKKKYWINVMEEQSLRGGLYVAGPWESEAEAFNGISLPDKLIKTITFEI